MQISGRAAMNLTDLQTFKRQILGVRRHPISKPPVTSSPASANSPKTSQEGYDDIVLFLFLNSVVLKHCHDHDYLKLLSPGRSSRQPDSGQCWSGWTGMLRRRPAASRWLLMTPLLRRHPGCRRAGRSVAFYY